MYRFIMSEPWYMEMILHNMCLKPGRTSRAFVGLCATSSPRLHLWFSLNGGICTERIEMIFLTPHLLMCFSHAFFEKKQQHNTRGMKLNPSFGCSDWLPNPPPTCLLLDHSPTENSENFRGRIDHIIQGVHGNTPLETPLCWKEHCPSNQIRVVESSNFGGSSFKKNPTKSYVTSTHLKFGVGDRG